MNNEARDAVLIGVFFIAYGALTWLANGGHLPTLGWWRRPVIGLDPSLLQVGKARRDTLIRQEGIDTDA